MADVHSSRIRSYNMSRIKGADTSPEILVRKYLFQKGFRYRKNVASLPGKPDIVLTKYRTCVFVNGCFWHRHEGCSYFKWPKTNESFWRKKIGDNAERDKKNYLALQNLGWQVLVVWECELKKDKQNQTLLNLENKIRENQFRIGERMETVIVDEYVNEDNTFQILRQVFTPNTDTRIGLKGGNEFYFSENDAWRVEYRPYRLPYNCAYKIKHGRFVVFEITPAANNEFVIHSTGEALSHLELDSQLLIKVGETLQYNPKYGHKHYFRVNDADLQTLFKAYLESKGEYDNGLVKPGEIRGVSRPHLKRRK